MSNADYVKSLGLSFKSLSAKIEGYWEHINLYTWEILNKNTNEKIGSYYSHDNGNISTVIGEWLLQEDAYVEDYDRCDSKVVLRNELTFITMDFVYDGADNDMIARQVYIDKINKLVGKDICGICDFSFLHKKETNIYIDYRNEKYILGSVDSFDDRDYKNKTIYYKRIETFTEVYEKNENSLLKRMLLVACNEFEKIACDESINFSKKNAICSELVKSVTKIISPAACTYSANMERSTHTQKYSLALLHQDKVYFIAKVNPNPNDDQKAVNENEIEEFIDAYTEDIANE